MMSRKVKEFIEIRDYTSLDTLIEGLTDIRDNLPANAEPELRMKGDDVFGRLLSVSYLRPQTAEEAECDARYTGTHRQLHARELQSTLAFRLRSAA